MPKNGYDGTSYGVFNIIKSENYFLKNTSQAGISNCLPSPSFLT
jgi:hypothetical protein